MRPLASATGFAPATAKDGLSRRRVALLLLILALAAALRLVRLPEAPPGIHVDAAANAWNANCIRQTGHDWSGASWPILYSRGFGENQTTLYYYALIPFQTVFGMSAVSTRLPSAFAGILSVWVIFAVGRRLFGTGVGLAAAAFLAVTPWHLFLSRWGQESGLVPLLSVLPLASLFWAGLLATDDSESEPDRLRAGLAGILTGVCCYGYPSVRVFVPALLIVLVVMNSRRLLALARTPKGGTAVAAFLLGLAVTFGPLAYSHLVDPEIAKRSHEFLVWDAGDPLLIKAGKALARLPGHFGPDFLFVHGDRFPLHQLPASGPLPFWLAPLLAGGIVAAVWEARTSRSARILLAWGAVYPLSDLCWKHDGMHLLRSAPGVCGFVLLAGLGAQRTWRFAVRRSRRAAALAAAVLVLCAAATTAWFLGSFFGEYNRRPDVYQLFNTDLLAASRIIRARWDHVDAVFVSAGVSAAMDQPFVVVLVGAGYEPEQWLRDDKIVEHRADTDLYRGFGKVRFLFDERDVAELRALETNGRDDRVLLVLRPGEWEGLTPIDEIDLPDGRPLFLIYETVM